MVDQGKPAVRVPSEAELMAAIDTVLAARRGTKTTRWSEEDMIRLAASGVAKVDLLGERGTTLCSMEEIAAMAGMLVLSGVLPPPHRRVLPEAYRNGDQS